MGGPEEFATAVKNIPNPAWAHLRAGRIDAARQSLLGQLRDFDSFTRDSVMFRFERYVAECK